MTDDATSYFSGTRAAALTHLQNLGHTPTGWYKIAKLPDEAATLFTSSDLTDGEAKTRCRHQRVICADGSNGTATTCWTTHGDYIEEWSASTCDN